MTRKGGLLPPQRHGPFLLNCLPPQHHGPVAFEEEGVLNERGLSDCESARRLNKMLKEWQWEEAHEYNEGSSDGEEDDDGGAGDESLWDFFEATPL